MMIWEKEQTFNKGHHKIETKYLCDACEYDSFLKTHRYPGFNYNYRVIYECTNCKLYSTCKSNLSNHYLCCNKENDATNTWCRMILVPVKRELYMYSYDVRKGFY